MRLSQVARKLNVGTSTIVDYLSNKGHEIDGKPNTKISEAQFDMLSKEFQGSAQVKEKASELQIGNKHVKNVVIQSESTKVDPKKEQQEDLHVKTNTAVPKKEENVQKEEPKKEEPSQKEEESDRVKLKGLNVLGKIDLGKQKAKPKSKKEAVEKAKPKEKATPKVEAPKAKVETAKKEQPKVGKEEVAKKEEVKKTAKAEKTEVKKTDSTTTPDKKEEAAKTPDSVVEPKSVEEAPKQEGVIKAKAEELKGLKILGKIELPAAKEKKKPGAKGGHNANDKKKGKRARIQRPAGGANQGGGNQGGGQGGNNQGGGNRFNKGGKRKPMPGAKKPGGRDEKKEVSAADIKEKIKATMAKMGGGTKSKTNRSKYKREKRKEFAENQEAEQLQREEEAKIIKVTEFISANDLATLMDVSVNDVISSCMMLGMFVSINQRLDAETITVITDEFGYEVEFSDAEDEEQLEEVVDAPEDLENRAPVVTIMGHVDHGKTSLLDYIRHSKVASGEAGGITQHIGAYRVNTDSGKPVAFLDTPGHEAFTAMRARGAKLTDIVILVVAADDDVMPQTKEAINHAQIAGVPIVVALNKIDKDSANPDKVKEQLANENLLVEDWGGKYQCQHVSAKTGEGIDELLDKVLLEAEMLNLEANPNKTATGAVVEASLDKGRGYLSTVLVQAGTLNIGDILIAGSYHGKVKAMMDHTGKRLEVAGPSTPIQVLGLDGAPQAGDKIYVAKNEREAKEITNKRAQLQREQSVRTKKHLTLDEIGRRLAIGNFKELNLIIKGDVDGSVEALTDSLLKLSTEEVAVNVIHKAVGSISESDVLLASASDAIILGFQVRPSQSAKKLAENEEIEIKHYSIIYKAIDEIKDALEGLLDPEVEEVITGNVQVRDVFKITKVGTVAGCYVMDGLITRNSTIRIIREGIVKYEGQIGALKRFKDDVAEVKFGYECGLSIKNYNDILVDDIIEVYEEREIKRKLK